MTPHSARDSGIPGLADVSLLRDPPATPRGIRTRAALIAAARTVFERDGYVDAKLTDITKAAHCATGTFYTYFASKDEIFHALLQSVQDDMLHPGFGTHVESGATPFDLIAASNRAYLEAYRRNARLMMLLEQAAALDSRIRDARIRRNHAFTERNADFIDRLQRNGLIDPTLDPSLTARALSAMVSRVAYVMFCLEDDPVDIDELSAHLSHLWANALRLRN